MKTLRGILLAVSGLLVAVCGALTDGCASTSRYIEGTHVAVGAWIPWENTMYGLEICQYLNGCYLKTASNTVFFLERDYCATNTYLWGALETRETTRTHVETKAP